MTSWSDGPARERDLYKSAFDALDLGVAIFDADLRLVHCNTHFLTDHYASDGKISAGTPFAEIIGSVAHLVASADPEAECAKIVELARAPDGEPREIATTEGRYFRYWLRRLDGGDLLFSLRNVTARRISQRAAAQREAELRAVLEQSAEGIYVFDAENRLVMTNSGFIEMAGLPPELCKPGTPFEDMARFRLRTQMKTPDADLDMALADRKREVFDSAAFSEEPRIEQVAGGRVAEVRRRRTDDGLMVAIYTDVTKREMATAALHQSEAEALAKSTQIAAILEHVPNGVAYLDEAGDLALANDDFYDLFDFPREMGPGTPGIDFTRFILQQTTDLQGDALEKAAKQRLERIYRESAGGAISWDTEHREDGQIIEIRRRLSPEGHLVETYMDVSDRENALAEARRHEKLANEKSDQLEAILRATADGVVIFDRDHRLMLMNEGYWERVHRHGNANSEIGTPFAEMIRNRMLHEGAREGQALDAAVRKRIDETLASARDHNPTIEPFPDGRIAEVQRRITPEGFLLIIFTDVTEREQSAADLRDAMKRYRAVVEDQTEMICRFDADFRLTFVNGPYQEALGAGGKSIVGQRFLDLIPEEKARRKILEGLEELSPENPFFNEVFHETLSDGAPHWLEWVNRALYDDDGSLIEYQAVGRDVTNEREALEAVARSERRFRELAAAHPVPVLIIDRESDEVLHASDPAIALFAPGRSDLGGLLGSDLFASPQDREMLLERIVADGGVNQLQANGRNVEGDRFPMEVSARLLEFSGRPAIVFGIADITERRRADDEIMRQREALAQSEKMSAMGSLLASVSHELNNPLAIIVGQSQLLEEFASDPKVAKRAERVRAAADRCARIVKTFLSMARQRPPRHEIVSLGAVVRDAAELVAYALESNGIVVECNLGDADDRVEGDADQLLQVIMNLLINAQQALVEIEGERRIHIDLSCDGSTVFIRIEDSGPGVPAATAERVFEPFFTTKPEGLGTGIGLAVSRNIVEAHGGEISLAEADLGGARFDLSLPVATADSPALSGETRDDWDSLPRQRILVVDDERDIATTIREFLEPSGHIVLVAGDGREALEVLEKQKVDILLTDIRMPDLDGPGLYREIVRRTLLPTESIAFMTGDTLSRSVEKFLAKIDAPLLEKPFSINELRDIITSVFAAQYNKISSGN